MARDPGVADRPATAGLLRLRVVALAALVGAAGCAEAATLSFSAVDPLRSELEVTVRSPSGIWTFGPNDYDRPCDDTGSCVPMTRPIRIGSAGSVRVEVTAVRAGATLLDDGRLDVFVAEGGETVVVFIDGADDPVAELGPPDVILEGAGGFELYVYLDYL